MNQKIMFVFNLSHLCLAFEANTTKDVYGPMTSRKLEIT